MADPETESDKDPRHQLQSGGGRDELNLAEFPIALLADRVPKGVKTLYFEDRVFDQQANRHVTRKLTITGSDAHGLPTAVDDEILVALIQLTKLSNNFASPEVSFTRYELLRLLGWQDVGKNYRRIDESLRRWVGVTLHYDKAWWNKETQTWASESFHILETVTIVDAVTRRRLKAKGQGDQAFCAFSWNKVVFRSFRADNLKRLDIDTYFALETSVAKRMFRFLDKRFYHRRRWDFDLQEFAFEHIGLSRTYADNGQIKAKLQPAIDELVSIGFIEEMPRAERYTKYGRGRWRITLTRALGKAPRWSNEGSPELIDLLNARGVAQPVAVELAAAYPADRIRAQIDVHDWLVARADARVSKNPAGYLVESIREGFAPPKGFKKPKAAPARAPRGSAAKPANPAEEEDQEAIVDAYLASLTQSDQEAFVEEAFAAANPVLLRRYQECVKEGNDGGAERHRRYIVGARVFQILGKEAGPGRLVPNSGAGVERPGLLPGFDWGDRPGRK